MNPLKIFHVLRNIQPNPIPYKQHSDPNTMDHGVNYTVRIFHVLTTKQLP